MYDMQGEVICQPFFEKWTSLPYENSLAAQGRKERRGGCACGAVVRYPSFFLQAEQMLFLPNSFFLVIFVKYLPQCGH